ncbi:Protein SHORT-ROOT [Capsicum chinense]|nr:Protein SHORT-ROOT [Capsicum chinense]
MEKSLFFTKPTNYSYFLEKKDVQYHHFHGHHHIHLINMQNPNQQPHHENSSSRSQSPEYGEPVSDAKWAPRLLRECATAIYNKDSRKIHHLLWMLNELASPYGDCNQKLAFYFLQALFCKATDTGLRCYKTLTSASEKSKSFDSSRKLILKFQEVSPWTTFGHVASNGALLEALDGENKLHIIDISDTFCTQWPTLLEALATRNDETPHLKLTVVVTESILVKSVMKEVAQRMEKFARLMGVPFEFNVISELNHLKELTKESLNIQEEEALAVNCIGALRKVEIEERGAVIRMLQSLNPKVVTIVEHEADFSSTRNDFVKCFEECLRFYTLYFEMLDESFPTTSNERLVIERESSKCIVKVLACDNEISDQGDSERRERGNQWSERLRECFTPSPLNDDAVDDVKALLKRYKAGWSLVQQQVDQESPGIYLTWREEQVVWASSWKPQEKSMEGTT